MMGLLTLEEKTRALPPPLSLSLSLSLSFSFSLTLHHLRTQQEDSHLQEESLHQESDLAATLVSHFQTVELQEIQVCRLSHPVCDSSKAH